MAPPDSELLCYGLPTRPKPDIGKILVTGATGYIGGRLVPELVARGYQVRVMVRAASAEHHERWPDAEIVVADALEPETLAPALEGIYAAYYLIHSLLLGRKEFESSDIRAAENFRKAAEAAGVRRIIYLGGLGEIQSPLSPHLRSRTRVAQELASGSVATTILRAAIIIGSGSASYEIIKHLVKNLPVLLAPSWMGTKCQPIAIRDVVKYLVGVLETPETAGESYDIGGKDVLTYKEMLKILADLTGKKRIFIPCPVRHIPLFAYLTSLFTPVPARMTRCLMEGITDEVVCQRANIRQVLPFQPLGYREALVLAMSREEQDKVHTRWSDAYPPAHELAIQLREIENSVRFKTAYSLLTPKSPSSLFRSICNIGGDKGWFNTNLLWWLRGAIDRILMGVGTARGRRSSSSLRVNDVIDFWRVEDYRQDELLLLRAEIKLPGMAWLQFKVDREERGNRLTVKAYFRPRGLFGKTYWYLFLPFHFFIFRNLIKQIEKVS